MVKYSYSKLTTFDNCALQYKFNYIDKLGKDFENSIESFMGSKVHDALEELYKKQKLGEIITLEKLIAYYKKEWKKDFSEEIKIVKKSVNEKNYFNLGIKYLTDYYKHYYPFNCDYTVGLEMEINLQLNDSYNIVGYIDRLSIKDNIYYIHDYKTSGTLPTNEEVNNNKQLALYAIAIKEKYNDVKEVKLVWHFLAFDNEIVLSKQESDYEKIKKEIIAKINEIENMKLDDFKPKESILCEWCVYASNCPVKKHEFKTKQLSIEEFQKDYGINLVNKYYELQLQKDKLNFELDEIEAKLWEYANKENIQNISGSITTLKLAIYDTVTLHTKNTPKYDALKKILKENNLEQLFSIDSYWLAKYLTTTMLEQKVIDKIMPLIDKKQTKKIYLNKTK